MKAFTISVILFLLIVSLAVFNAIYINNVANELIADAKDLKTDDGSVYEFKEKWEKHQLIFRISSSHKETHRIGEAIEILLSKSQGNILSGFEEEKALLIEYITQIKEDETVSLDSII